MRSLLTVSFTEQVRWITTAWGRGKVPDKLKFMPSEFSYGSQMPPVGAAIGSPSSSEGRRFRHGNESFDHRAGPLLRATDLKCAAHLTHAFAHADDAVRLRFTQRLLGEPDAVVDDAQTNAVLLAGQRNAHAVGLRMLGDI